MIGKSCCSEKLLLTRKKLLLARKRKELRGKGKGEKLGEKAHRTTPSV
jgi:hypothetical protein